MGGDIMRAHIIKDGKIDNTIEVESLDFMPGLIDAALGGKVGDTWDEVSFTSPEPEPPTIEERFTALKTDFLTYLVGHYDMGTQATMQARYVSPETPQETKQRIEEAWAWIRTVQLYYLEKKVAVLAGSVDTKWDFSQFDTPKPAWDWEDFV